MGHPPRDYLLLLLVLASTLSRQVVHRVPEGERGSEALWIPPGCCQNCSTQWDTVVGAWSCPQLLGRNPAHRTQPCGSQAGQPHALCPRAIHPRCRQTHPVYSCYLRCKVQSSLCTLGSTGITLSNGQWITSGTSWKQTRFFPGAMQ